MLLSELKKSLAEHSFRNVRFILPTGTRIPPHAHVTEVARIDKMFIDCGGTRRTEITCRLQTWFQDDTGHRLAAGKFLAILDQATFIKTDNLEVEVEPEAPFLSQFPIAKAKSDGEELVLHLGIRHTACLAEDRGLPPVLNQPTIMKRLPDFKAGKCC